MIYRILPFCLAVYVCGNHVPGYIAACIRAGIITGRG